MDFLQKINQDLVTAMKEKKSERASLFRSLKAALKYAQIALKVNKLSEADVIKVLTREAKKRKESIAAFKEGHRDDLVAKEQTELDVIETYLPKQLLEEEIQPVISKILSSFSQKPAFGQLMGKVMVELKGKADGALIQKLVKKTLE